MSHFHMDLNGSFIPGLCTGLAIRTEDLGKPLDPTRYPILSTLFERGINGLHDMACGQHGFRATRRYLSKCDLCLDIRSDLAANGGDPCPELQPRWFYSEVGGLSSPEAAKAEGAKTG
ncbi:MAG: hypothetical protein AB9873_19145 [Syntrophobacteraceae bacterium]